MRRYVSALLALLLLALPATAKIGTIDVVPSATLLIPYFEADVTRTNGINTVFTIQNASASALVAHATLWTDYGIPTQGFDIYLTGFDQETIDVRQLFLSRSVPVTADAGSDPGDTSSPNDGISNKGPLSQDINFPGTTPPVATGQAYVFAPDLIAAHQGTASANYFNGLCGAKNYGDGIVRGYVTIDTVTQGNPEIITASNYANTTLDRRNIMLGEYYYIDAAGRMSAENAVHIEAAQNAFDGSSYTNFAAGDETFYGRFVGLNGSDQREPLPTAFAGPISANRTTIHYWRDPGVSVAPFACGGTPSPFPMNNVQTLGFDSEENSTAIAGTFFPLASGSVTVGAGGIPLTAKKGWLFTNMNVTAANGVFGTTRQSWMTYEIRPEGLPATTPMGYGVHGIQLGNAGNAANPTIP